MLFTRITNVNIFLLVSMLPTILPPTKLCPGKSVKGVHYMDIPQPAWSFQPFSSCYALPMSLISYRIVFTPGKGLSCTDTSLA